MSELNLALCTGSQQLYCRLLMYLQGHPAEQAGELTQRAVDDDFNSLTELTMHQQGSRGNWGFGLLPLGRDDEGLTHNILGLCQKEIMFMLA
jgi:hypothetical protein